MNQLYVSLAKGPCSTEMERQFLERIEEYKRVEEGKQNFVGTCLLCQVANYKCKNCIFGAPKIDPNNGGDHNAVCRQKKYSYTRTIAMGNSLRHGNSVVREAASEHRLKLEAVWQDYQQRWSFGW